VRRIGWPNHATSPVSGGRARHPSSPTITSRTTRKTAGKTESCGLAVDGSGIPDPGRTTGRFSVPRTLMYPWVHCDLSPGFSPQSGIRASTKIDFPNGIGNVLNHPPTAEFFPHSAPACRCGRCVRVSTILADSSTMSVPQSYLLAPAAPHHTHTKGLWGAGWAPPRKRTHHTVICSIQRNATLKLTKIWTRSWILNSTHVVCVRLVNPRGES
jgi:hypothetical protein